MKKWETEILELVRETYHKNGYESITILVGALRKDNGDICTQFLNPGHTASSDEFDFRFMIFSMLNHVFSDFNKYI